MSSSTASPQCDDATRRSSHRAKYLPDFQGESIDSNRFLLLTCLGVGGYGKVYKAIDMDRSAPTRPSFVAVKCMAKPKHGSRQYRAQRRELKFHAAVSEHPNIITFRDAFCDHSYVYMVLDFCSGGDLFKAIVDKQLYHEQDELIKSVFTQILSAVHHCHANGIYHRDLKPENILCNDDGTRILLTDFGLATDRPYTGDHGVGSSFYMSYENVNFDDGDYDTAMNDVWSCGIILINMVTGRNPWMKAVDNDECFSYYLANEDFLLDVLPLSLEMNDIVKKVLSPRPEERMPIVGLLQAVLAVRSFFLSPDELEVAPEPVRQAAREAQPVPVKHRVPTAFPVVSTASYGVELDEELPGGTDIVIRHKIYAAATPPTSRASSITLPTDQHSVAMLAMSSSNESDLDVEALTPEDALGPTRPHGVKGDDDVPFVDEDALGGGSLVSCKKPWIERMPGFKRAYDSIRRFSSPRVHGEGEQLELVEGRV